MQGRPHILERLARELLTQFLDPESAMKMALLVCTGTACVQVVELYRSVMTTCRWYCCVVAPGYARQRASHWRRPVDAGLGHYRPVGQAAARSVVPWLGAAMLVPVADRWTILLHLCRHGQ